MAQSLDVRSRDIRKELDPSDPLFELTRIMGISAPREVAKEPADPQLSIEDDFSLDLDQDLQLDQDADVELNAGDLSLDDDFNRSFDEELSGNMQFGDKTPPVAPSLEDELEALLADGPEAELAAPRYEEQDFVEPDFVEQDFSDDQLPEPELEMRVEAEQSFEAEANFAVDEVADDEPAMEAAPWLEPDLEPLMGDSDDAELIEVASNHVASHEVASNDVSAKDEDPILAQMNRVFGRSNLTPVQPVAPEPEHAAAAAETSELSDSYVDDYDVSDPELDSEDMLDDPIVEMAELNFNEDEVADSLEAPQVEISELDWDEPVDEVAAEPSLATDLGRLVGKTEPEPIVEVAEFDTDMIAATDDLDIPDFDLPSETTAAMTASYDLDDEYQGYEPPVVKATTRAVDPQVMEDFASDMPQPDDDTDIDFESMLNDELTASVEQNDSHGAYVGAAAATVAGAAAYRMQNKIYNDDMPHVDNMAEDIDAPAAYQNQASHQEKTARKGTWLIAAAVGAIAVLGAGYYAMSGPSTGASGTAPVLVKADPDPVKVVPETPGGKAVANQDQAVYDKVGGEGTALPSQGQLVSESEEPVDIASVATNDPVDPNAKSEDRVDPAQEPEVASGQSADTLAVSPKKVRTVVVKPDGTLVERPAETAAIPADAATAAPVPVPAPAPEAPAVAAQTPAPAVETPAQETVTAAVTQETAPQEPTVDAIAKAEEPAVETPAVETPKAAAPAIKVVKTKKIKAPAAEPAAETASLDADPKSNAAPILESRPADQPVNIVGKTGKAEAAAETQVAAADPAPAPSGSYSIQIASTPSPEAAKSTYAALSRKFGSVLGGRGVTVQKAEVDGKGTVYRVRIPAGSKQEANALCQQYKSAGGNCFITK